MFFWLSKILWAVVSPGMLLILLLALGLLFHFKGLEKLSIVLLFLSLGGFLIIAITPLPQLFFSVLENRFPVTKELPKRIDGIIVLGGSVEEAIYEQKGLVTLNSTAERLSEFVKLGRAYPKAKMVFTGGTNNLSAVGKTEADTSRQFFKDVGFDVSRIVFEDQSRNTIENVKHAKEIIKPKKDENWILVTSAFHMPRSVGVFRKQEWDVIPYPTDFRLDETKSYGLHYDIIDGLSILDVGLHEYAGLIVYYLKGETQSLFPSPEKQTDKKGRKS